MMNDQLEGDDGPVKRMRFRVELTAGPRGTLVVAVPFDPDHTWSAKANHPVNGTINGRFTRGRLVRAEDGWQLPISGMWARDCELSEGMTVDVDLAPEGAQLSELAPDFAAALEENPAAAEFFDTLAQFYTKAYLQWIDATKRRPELRAERIAKVVSLLEQGIKQRPRPRTTPSGE